MQLCGQSDRQAAEPAIGAAVRTMRRPQGCEGERLVEIGLKEGQETPGQ